MKIRLEKVKKIGIPVLTVFSAMMICVALTGMWPSYDNPCHSYMLLNVCRFGNAFEFGHSYLPEFVRAENGQFSFAYFADNLKELFRLPRFDLESQRTMLYSFGGQMVWLLNSMLFLVPISGLYSAVLKKGKWVSLLIVSLYTAVYLCIVLCHRTLGGWQFGNRYVVDVLPYLFCELATAHDEGPCLDPWLYPLCYVGMMLNMVGTVALYCKWI